MDSLHPNCPKNAALGEGCHEVYAGHNTFGADIAWLPTRLLMQWWQTLVDEPSLEPTSVAEKVMRGLGGLIPTDSGGSNHQLEGCGPAPGTRSGKFRVPENNSGCARAVDAAALQLLNPDGIPHTSGLAGRLATIRRVEDSTRGPRSIISWAPTYASLPVLRVVLMRDPFPFAVSKFFWGERGDWPADCQSAGCPGGAAWIEEISIEVILMLCGPDCYPRYHAALESDGGPGGRLPAQALLGFEQQAADNLRTAFAVVGLVNETGAFYQMLSTRVAYLNIGTESAKTAPAHSHKSSIILPGPHKQCTAAFKDPEFQRRVVRENSAFAALQRLYHVAVEVNRFQQRELAQCPAA